LPVGGEGGEEVFGVCENEVAKAHRSGFVTRCCPWRASNERLQKGKAEVMKGDASINK